MLLTYPTVVVVAALAFCGAIPGSAQCSGHTSCTNCIPGETCGWEADHHRCSPGSDIGPEGGGLSTSWIFGSSANCSGDGINMNCYWPPSCLLCLSQPRCGWAGNQCFPGDSSGPHWPESTIWIFGDVASCQKYGYVSTSPGLATWAIAVIIIIGVLACTLIIFAGCYFYRRRRGQKVVTEDVSLNEYNPPVIAPQQFSVG